MSRSYSPETAFIGNFEMFHGHQRIRAFQAENITQKAFFVVLIAIPILIQVYFNSSLAYGLMKLFRVPYAVAAPGALIGASNFFELAVATAIALYAMSEQLLLDLICRQDADPHEYARITAPIWIAVLFGTV